MPTRALLYATAIPRERFNSNMKNNLRRWRARLAGHGNVTPVRLAPGGDLARWSDEIPAPRGERLEGAGGSALRLPRGRPSLRRRGLPRAFRRGRLLITGLDLGGKPLARH
jgi:hypothetical protein